jgi:hypothetical protein
MDQQYEHSLSGGGCQSGHRPVACVLPYLIVQTGLCRTHFTKRAPFASSRASVEQCGKGWRREQSDRNNQPYVHPSMRSARATVNPKRVGTKRRFKRFPKNTQIRPFVSSSVWQARGKDRGTPFRHFGANQINGRDKVGNQQRKAYAWRAALFRSFSFPARREIESPVVLEIVQLLNCCGVQT